MLHQTAHWQTRGGNYYSDHLLFQRLYEEAQEGVDGLAERLIGLSGDPGQVSLCRQVQIMKKMIEFAHQGNSEPAPHPEKLVSLALNAETLLLGGIPKVRQQLEEAGAWTDGLDDLIPAIAGKHESFVYLLKQRATNEDYSYNRG
jgi:DNA-binding ferritin-like protein